ncbi:unnamed protein product [Caenorhabditis brenneri]
MSTLSKFPLFKLPWLAIKGVISNMDFGTLLYLSFSSKSIYRFIQSLRITVKVFEVFFDEFDTRVLFSFAKWYGIGEWSFKETEPGIKYLTQLFICPLPKIYIFPDDMKKPILPSLVGFGDYCEDMSFIGKEEIENEELYMLLNKYTIKEEINFDIPLKKDFASDISLWKHPNRMFILNAHWVTDLMLFDLKCRSIMLGECKQLKAIDCRLFVDRWMSSNDLNFHFLELLWSSDYPEGLNYDFFGGLGLEKFDPKSRSYAYCHHEGYAIDVSMGRDFKRKDGLLATITLNHQCFIFCVWHERFPSLEGREVVHPTD